MRLLPTWQQASGLLVAGLPAILFPLAAQDWPQFRGNPQLTGVAPAGPAAPLKVLWTYQAAEPIESSPAVAGGVVYVGCHSGELIALDLKTGKLRWRYKAAEAIGESSPAVAAGTVYVGDLSGALHAVAVEDGKPRWVFKTRSEIKSSPVVVEGTVLVGSYDGRLYAVDARTGKVVWSFQSEQPVHATAAVAGGMAFITGCDGRLRAIRVKDGTQAYEIAIDSYMGASPALSGDRAFVGTFDNQVLGINLRAKTVLWRYEHPQRKFPFYSSAALAGGLVLAGGRDKMMHALDPKTGRARWTFAARARIDSSPAVAGGQVFFGSNDGRLYALDVATGKKVWEHDAGAPISSSPAIAGGHIVIATQDGVVYCFGGQAAPRSPPRGTRDQSNFRSVTLIVSPSTSPLTRTRRLSFFLVF